MQVSVLVDVVSLCWGRLTISFISEAGEINNIY
jgi:hypothetical protein